MTQSTQPTQPAQPAQPAITWDIGTAYDFFVSLYTLHNPSDFGLRGAWAVGVRSRLPQESREFLQEVMSFLGWPLDWIHALPAPKSAAAALEALAVIPPAERLPRLSQSDPDCDDPIDRHLLAVAARGAYDDADETAILDLIAERHGERKMGKMKEKVRLSLAWWSRPAEFGEKLLQALRAYHENFFAEDELRLQPALEEAVARAQDLARSLPPVALLRELSQGVQLDLPDTAELVLAPSYWGSPLLLLGPHTPQRQIILFGGRPADASIVPGEVIPDTLHQSLKALADPTRLRILRYLVEEPLTPSELASRLRLRPPTVIHHLQTLRLARLVSVIYGEDGKRYQARTAAVDEMVDLLKHFLGGAADS